jgi:GT2 family glycosyltransferase
MKKWTVVIPTMWKSELLKELLSNLIQSNRVDEIIIIDNNYRGRFDIPISTKIKLIKESKNIFVNPAWNKGIDLAKNKHVCLCNDDVLFCSEIFDSLEKLNFESSVYGCHLESFHLDISRFSLEIQKGHHISSGWGCVIFLDKFYFKEIPMNLKILFGDNWLVHHFKYCYALKYPIKTQMGTTSSRDEMNAIVREDAKKYSLLFSAKQILRLELRYNRGKSHYEYIRHYLLENNIVWPFRLYRSITNLS